MRFVTSVLQPDGTYKDGFREATPAEEEAYNLKQEIRWAQIEQAEKEEKYRREQEKARPMAIAFETALKNVGFGNSQSRPKPAAAQELPAETWVSSSASELVAEKIPPRLSVMEEKGAVLFYEKSINQILSWRGVGKTNFALGLADAIASGGRILDFQATRARRVLYVDGELPKAQLQERVRDLVAPEHRHNLRLFSPEMLKKPQGLNFLEDRDFSALQRVIGEHRTEVIFLDSQSTVMQGEAIKYDFQERHQTRMTALRLMGLTVIELHHVGKNGLQRGLSKNDDILDVQMHLKKVDGWEPGDGLLFEVAYDKVRHAAALDIQPMPLTRRPRPFNHPECREGFHAGIY